MLYDKAFLDTHDRELSVAEAQTMMTATLKWREEMKIDEIMKEEFPDKVFLGVGRIFGKDKGGRPVVCVEYFFTLEVTYHEPIL